MEQNKDKMIVLDTETTGLKAGDDELLQISIIDCTGKTILDTLVRPSSHTSWEQAMAINHITPEMVADAPTLEELRPRLERIFHDAESVVGYNVSFDLGFLRAAGIETTAKKIDVMLQFSEFYAEEKEELYKDFFEPGVIYYQECDRRHKLTECAAHLGYKWDGDAHNSLADAKATLYCYDCMNAIWAEREAVAEGDSR